MIIESRDKMKKALIIMSCIMCILITGCGDVKLKEGTYKATAVDNYGGQENTASAEVVINSQGKIESVYLDTTYMVDGVQTTKKTSVNGQTVYYQNYVVK